MAPDKNSRQEIITEKDLETLLKMIASVRFGTVTIVIQDGRVIQIERSEKIRLV